MGCHSRDSNLGFLVQESQTPPLSHRRELNPIVRRVLNEFSEEFINKTEKRVQKPFLK